MEVLNYSTTNWKDIPRQDNPAFDYTKSGEGVVRREEALMIVKSNKHESGTCVLIYVPLTGDVVSLGCFWYVVHAQLFAQNLIHEDLCKLKE